MDENNGILVIFISEFIVPHSTVKAHVITDSLIWFSW
jgi:hypothetical protein